MGPGGLPDVTECQAQLPNRHPGASAPIKGFGITRVEGECVACLGGGVRVGVELVRHQRQIQAETESQLCGIRAGIGSYPGDGRGPRSSSIGIPTCMIVIRAQIQVPCGEDHGLRLVRVASWPTAGRDKVARP